MAEINYLNDLLDVSVPAPADGDILYWDAGTELWKAKQPPVGVGTVERQVRVSSDDISVFWNGGAWVRELTPTAQWSGWWGATYAKCGGGGRFLNIYIPPGATINHAYLKLISYQTRTETGVRTRLHGEQNINPATFSTYANYAARTRTDAVIDWDDIPSWTVNEEYQSLDIKDIIQEIIELDGWASGNPLAIFWDDHDDRSDHNAATVRRYKSWDHADRQPPMLYIEWVA